MIESALGVILRTRPLTETSLIVHWLTADLGRLSTVAKGAHRAKSPFAGKLDLFYEAYFSFQRSRRSELHALREVSLRDTHAPLRTELEYVQHASYAAALIEQTTETETPLPAAFALLTTFLAHLPRHSPQGRSVCAMELKWLNELGLRPDLGKSRLTSETQALVSTMLDADWATISRLEISARQARELQQFLHGYLIYHLGRIPPGRILHRAHR